MSIEHLQRIRQNMPATEQHIYLNAGTFGPVPTCVVEAIHQCMQREWQNGRLGYEAFAQITAIYDSARNRVAHLIGASPDEIALTDNTGEGLNIVCYGFNWQAGDEIITTNHEHLSALAPLYQIRDRYGVRIHLADIGSRADRSLTEVIEPLITPHTRLILLSHVTWTTGAVLDINAAGRLAHAHNIPVLIDGAQSAGNIPLNMKELDIDFYAIPMQKWLCGPDGTGALYIRQESLQHIKQTYTGYYSFQFEHDGSWKLHTNARSFELGGRQTAGIAGQQAVLQWLDEVVGHDWLFERISALNTYAYNALKEIPGVTIHTPKAGASGILAFALDGHTPEEIVKYLQDRNIYIRNIPEFQLLRVSTGFYNTEADIDALIKSIRELAS